MRIANWPGSAALSLAMLVAVMWGEARAAWRVAGQIGGPISAVAAAGDIAYIGVGARLLVYDLANPALPREIGSTPGLGDHISNVFVAGARAYVAAGTTGVHVFDVTEPANPRLIGRWDSPGSADGLSVVGDTAYVADGPFGLQIVDFSNPSAPLARGSAFDMRFAFDVIVEGTHAFIAAAGSGLLVADIADAARPRELTMVDTPGFARALALSGTALYLADQWGGVRVYDVSDPARPRETAGMSLPSWAFDVAATASTLFVADGARGLRLYAASNPQGGELGSYEIPLQLAWKVAVTGDRVLVAARAHGVHVIDTRAQPRRLSVISPVSNVQSVAARDNILFLGTGDQGLRIVDLSDPSRPAERGSGADGRGWAVMVDDTRAYLCNGMSPQTHRLRVFDVTNLDRPTEVAAASVSAGICRDLVRAGPWLYVANEFGIQTFDLSNPNAPTLVGAVQLPTGSGTHGSSAGVISIALAGSTAFVPNATNGVGTIDLSDPRNPRHIGGWSQSDPPVHVGGVDARNGFVFVVSGLPVPELIVLDARDPARPVRRGGALLPESANHVVVRGSLAYVAAGASGVIVLDIANPTAPVEVERIATPGYANKVTFAGNLMLVAAGDGGLYVLEPASGGSAPSRRTLDGRTARRRQSGSGAQPRLADATPARRVVAPDRRLRSGPLAARSVVITSTADSGAGTLREALTNLQAEDAITFDPGVFPPNNPPRIRPTSPLPRVTRDGVTIDGSNAGVILDGTALSGRFDAGLSISSGGNTIKGLQILDFPNAGILITGGNGGRNVIGGDRSRGAGPSGEGNVLSRNQTAGILVSGPNSNRIIGNRIGTDASGRTALGRQERGVWIFARLAEGEFANGDWVGGYEPWEANVISGNVFDEVNLQNTSGHRVVGNYIGTDPSGTTRVGDATTAVSMGVASDNVISGNVIVARQHALFLGDAGSCCNQIVGNWIGVTRAGTPIVRDSQSTGIGILESFNLVANNFIGGVQYGGVNVNGYQAAATETVIIGNRIGTGLGGLRPERWGMSFGATSRTFIGGATDAERNFVIGNDLGLRLMTPGVDRTFVMGNSIGVDGAGRPFRNNGDGLDIGRATLSFVQGNVIAENAGRGVVIAGDRNWLRRNSIYANAREGISVSGGVAPAPPVVQSVAGSTVAGTACPNCTVEIHSDDRDQGRTYEGTALANASGAFSFTKDGSLRGPNITALATNSAGSTSAFSIAQRGGSTMTNAPGAARVVPAAATASRHSIAAPALGFMTPAVRDTRAGITTEIVLVNGSADAAEVTMSLRGPDGVKVGAGERRASLPPQARWAASLDRLFPAADTTAFRGTVMVIIEQGEVVVTATHSGPVPDAFALPVVPLDQPAPNQVWLPYFLEAPGISTSFVVMNPSNGTNRGEIEFYDQLGVPLAVDLGGPRPASRFAFTLPPYGSAIVTSGGSDGPIAGSARVTTESLATAAAVTFGSADHGWAGGGPAGPGLVAAIPIVRSVAAGYSTLVSIVSTGAVTTVKLTLTDADGRPFRGAETTVVVPAHGQIADLVEHLLGGADISEFKGRLLVTSDAADVVAAAIPVNYRLADHRPRGRRR